MQIAPGRRRDRGFSFFGPSSFPQVWSSAVIATHNLRVDDIEPLIAPRDLLAQLPLSEPSARFVTDTRREIAAALRGTDSRPLVFVGPCSIHDPRSALEYA